MERIEGILKDGRGEEKGGGYSDEDEEEQGRTKGLRRVSMIQIGEGSIGKVKDGGTKLKMVNSI